jgi:hypothetical protein
VTSAFSDRDDQRQLDLWVEQFKSTTSGIAARVDLQQKNSNVAIVLTTAITGYLLTFWSQKGLDALLTGQVVIVLSLMPFALTFFALRHLDHEANILDFAGYINGVIRPAVATLVGADVLVAEERLQTKRRERLARLWGVSVLGNDLTLMYAVTVPYLACGWLVRFGRADRGGDARPLFDATLYGETLFFLLSIVVAVKVLQRYGEISVTTETPTVAPASAEQGLEGERQWNGPNDGSERQ